MPHALTAAAYACLLYAMARWRVLRRHYAILRCLSTHCAMPLYTCCHAYAIDGDAISLFALNCHAYALRHALRYARRAAYARGVYARRAITPIYADCRATYFTMPWLMLIFLPRFITSCRRRQII